MILCWSWWGTANLPGSGPNLGYNAAQMIDVDTNIVRKTVSSALLILAYGFYLWRIFKIFKSNPGDRFIQCATLTVMVLVAAAAANRIHNFPDWVLTSLLVLLYLLTFLSIFFMLQEGYRALRRRYRVIRRRKVRLESAK
jgi:hypothetical protein